MYVGPALRETEAGKSPETTSKPAWEVNPPENRREMRAVEEENEEQHGITTCLKVL